MSVIASNFQCLQRKKLHIKDSCEENAHKNVNKNYWKKLPYFQQYAFLRLSTSIVKIFYQVQMLYHLTWYTQFFVSRKNVLENDVILCQKSCLSSFSVHTIPQL